MAVGAVASGAAPTPVRIRKTTSLAVCETYKNPRESITESDAEFDPEPLISALKSVLTVVVFGTTPLHVLGHAVKSEASSRY